MIQYALVFITGQTDVTSCFLLLFWHQHACSFHCCVLEWYTYGRVPIPCSTYTYTYVNFSNGVCTSSPTYSCTVWNYTNSYRYCLNSYFLAVLIVWPSMNTYRCYGKIRIEPVPRWIRIIHTQSLYVRVHAVLFFSICRHQYWYSFYTYICTYVILVVVTQHIHVRIHTPDRKVRIWNVTW